MALWHEVRSEASWALCNLIKFSIWPRLQYASSYRRRGSPVSKPPAYAYLPFRLPKQEEPRIRGLISSVKINCEFLAANSW